MLIVLVLAARTFIVFFYFFNHSNAVSSYGWVWRTSQLFYSSPVGYLIAKQVILELCDLGIDGLLKISVDALIFYHIPKLCNDRF